MGHRVPANYKMRCSLAALINYHWICSMCWSMHKVTWDAWQVTTPKTRDQSSTAKTEMGHSRLQSGSFSPTAKSVHDISCSYWSDKCLLLTTGEAFTTCMKIPEASNMGRKNRLKTGPPSLAFANSLGHVAKMPCTPTVQIPHSLHESPPNKGVGSSGVAIRGKYQNSLTLHSPIMLAEMIAASQAQLGKPHL